MIILYLKINNQYIMKIDGFPEVEEKGNKLYLKDGRVILNDLTKAGYREYPDQPFEIPTEMDEEAETTFEKTVTLDELGLRDFTAEELIEKQKPSLEERVTTLEEELKDN